MPNSNEHFLIGCIAGALAYAGYKYCRGEEISLGKTVKAGIIGGITALAPDIIEPATNPNHRALAHSVLTLGGCFGAQRGLQDWNTESEIEEILAAAIGGYSSHIIIDSLTPKGIPIIA